MKGYALSSLNLFGTRDATSHGRIVRYAISSADAMTTKKVSKYGKAN